MVDDEELIVDVSRTHLANIVNSHFIKCLGGEFHEKMREVAKAVAADFNAAALVSRADPLSFEDAGRLVEHYATCYFPLAIDSLRELDEKTRKPEAEPESVDGDLARRVGQASLALAAVEASDPHKEKAR